MDLAFSEDDEALRSEFSRVIASGQARASFTRNAASAIDDARWDRTLWSRLAENGWLGAGIDEQFGGSALGALSLCVLSEECGRQLAAVPFTAAVCGFATVLALSGNDDAQQQWLPRIADGSAVGVVLGPQLWLQAPQLSGGGGVVEASGSLVVPDGAAATVAVSFVGSGSDARLLLLELPLARSLPPSTEVLDLLHAPAAVNLSGAAATVLASGAQACELWDRFLDRAALFTAFEQLGGAQAALDMARSYSLTRYAFGRPIGSFQALKHAMADMLAAMELARSNCYFGAAALDGDEDTLREAATVARISATDAFRLCARQNQQILGGIGVTWESDAHLYYRRAHALSMLHGSPVFWKERLIQLLLRRHPQGFHSHAA